MQACAGDQLESGTKVQFKKESKSASHDSDDDDDRSCYVIPNHADIIYACAAPVGTLNFHYFGYSLDDEGQRSV